MTMFYKVHGMADILLPFTPEGQATVCMLMQGKATNYMYAGDEKISYYCDNNTTVSIIDVEESTYLASREDAEAKQAIVEADKNDEDAN